MKSITFSVIIVALVFLVFISSISPTTRSGKSLQESKQKALINKKHGTLEEKREIRPAVELNPDMKKAYDAAKEIFVRSMLIAFAGTPIGQIIGMFVAILNVAVSQKKGDLWTTFRGKVKVQISQSLAGYHFDSANRHFAYFNKLAEYGTKGVGISELLPYFRAKYDMLPQNYNNIGFTEELGTLLPTWTAYFVPIMLELINEKKIHKCKLAYELNALRKDTIMAAKALCRKRYKEFQGISYNDQQPTWISTCTKGRCDLHMHLEYEDGYTETKKKQTLGRVYKEAIQWVESDTWDKIMKVMVNPINEWIDKRFCMKNCRCPKKISRSDISWKFPQSCFGRMNDEPKRTCFLPCASYGKGYLWCPLLPKSKGDNNPATNDIFERNGDTLYNFWQYCHKANWEECMPVETSLVVAPPPVPTVAPQKSKKKKGKEH